MAEERWQIDSKIMSLGNVLVLEQILRNLITTAAAANSPEPTPQPPSLPPAPEPVIDKHPDQPLDLSMKTDLSPTGDLDYKNGGERLEEIHEMNLDDPFFHQHLDQYKQGSPDGGLSHSTEMVQEQRSIRNSPVLWQFLIKCLNSEQCNPAVIKWVCKEQGVFRLTNVRLLAQLWGEKKHKPNMSEENLKRSLRYYYGKKILTKVQGHRDVYKFYVNLP
ncbi:ETS transcription factor Elf 2 [Echinococcus multilocularis]|uniref:ETS transcription factor Elf 2 n=1 Tax=Echinococcus multilocularis TaxID=6211 RepID=A0A068YA37_ECHMU|nr:ETS transcription factor Elf 2 [Echinococcus multilocularis]